MTEKTNFSLKSKLLNYMYLVFSIRFHHWIKMFNNIKNESAPLKFEKCTSNFIACIVFPAAGMYCYTDNYEKWQVTKFLNIKNKTLSQLTSFNKWHYWAHESSLDLEAQNTSHVVSGIRCLYNAFHWRKWLKTEIFNFKSNQLTPQILK